MTNIKAHRKLPVLLGVVFFVVAALAVSPVLAAPTQSTPSLLPDPIVIKASDALSAGQPLGDVVKQAFDDAKKVGLSEVELAAPLAEVLMINGIQAGRDGAALAGEIVLAIGERVCELKLSPADSLRVVSQAILGLRSAAARMGIDDATIKAQITASLDKVTCLPTAQVAQMVDGAFQAQTALTFTAPGTLLQTVVRRELRRIRQVNRRWDPTADADI